MRMYLIGIEMLFTILCNTNAYSLLFSERFKGGMGWVSGSMKDWSMHDKGMKHKCEYEDV